MTNIEKLNLIKTHFETCEGIEGAAEVIEYCETQIASLEKDKARNAERRAKKAEENAPIIAAITELLNEEGITAADAATVVGVSVQKASSILRGLVTDHVANVQDTKIPKKGSCKLYTKA
jgi:Fic family protein